MPPAVGALRGVMELTRGHFAHGHEGLHGAAHASEHDDAGL